MESEKEFKEELKEVLPIYKIAGIVIGVLLLIGVIFALITEFRPHKTAPVVPKVEPTPISNITEPNLTQNFTENVTTNISNVTVPNLNTTSNETNITNATNVTNVSVIAIPTPQPTLAPANYSWSTVTINFPDKLKKVPSNSTSFHYIEILEGDGTPITNGEQFDLTFDIDDHHGRKTQVLATFESGKWLIGLLLPNQGNYTLILTVECAPKKGYCKRFYGDGSVQKTLDFEVV